MLKTFDKLEDVPEGLREHYKLIQGKYVPELSDDHPVLATNKTLLNEKNTAESKVSGLETKIAGLQADVDSAKAGNVPRGHVAVTKAEAEALVTLKEHGTATEIVTKLTEHKTLKADAETRARQDNLRAVAKELDYNPDAFALLPGLPEFKINEKDGKKTVVALVKEGENTVEKAAKEFIEGAPAFAPFLPALKVSNGGIGVLGEKRDSGKPSNDLITRNQQVAKDIEKTGPQPNLARERFGLARPAEATQ